MIIIIIQKATLIENLNKDKAISFKQIFLKSNFLLLIMNIYQNFKLKIGICNKKRNTLPKRLIF